MEDTFTFILGVSYNSEEKIRSKCRDAGIEIIEIKPGSNCTHEIKINCSGTDKDSTKKYVEECLSMFFPPNHSRSWKKYKEFISDAVKDPEQNFDMGCSIELECCTVYNSHSTHKNGIKYYIDIAICNICNEELYSMNSSDPLKYDFSKMHKGIKEHKRIEHP